MPRPQIDSEAEDDSPMIEVGVVDAGWHRAITDPIRIAEQAAAAALARVAAPAGAELSIRLTNDAEVCSLNRQYRGLDKPTNVLSFAGLDASSATVSGGPALLGDVVVALETVLAEARAEGKPPDRHLSHLVVHGVLHLLGFDHQEETAADHMEALEVRILGDLGVANPYATPSDEVLGERHKRST